MTVIMKSSESLFFYLKAKQEHFESRRLQFSVLHPSFCQISSIFCSNEVYESLDRRRIVLTFESNNNNGEISIYNQFNLPIAKIRCQFFIPTKMIIFYSIRLCFIWQITEKVSLFSLS